MGAAAAERVMQGLLIGPEQRDALTRLRDLAARCPVAANGLMQRLADPAEKDRHMRQMGEQTIDLPIGYTVTLSIETGHPGGTARHLSVSCKGRLPHPATVWMIAEELGFVGSLELCNAIWPEQLRGHGLALNIVQFIAQDAPARVQ